MDDTFLSNISRIDYESIANGQIIATGRANWTALLQLTTSMAFFGAIGRSLQIEGPIQLRGIGDAARVAEQGVIGKIKLPSNWKFGTTVSGQDAHVAAEVIVRDQLVRMGVDANDITSSVLPGQRGVDMSIDPKYLTKLGFEHLEIKSNTPSGEATYNRQVVKWKLDPTTVRVITYDANGTLRWGFKY